MKKVLLTGASGSMGNFALKELAKTENYIRVFSLDNVKERSFFKPYKRSKNIEFIYGDLCNYSDVYKALEGIDIVIHLAAFISPYADEKPKLSFKINYGSTKNIIDAIKARGMENTCQLVYVGSVAMTGDRMPPIHWGRVGDPLKPSVFDYYALAKIAAERLVIESGLKYWVSLRQTGIISERMLSIRDSIIFHQPLNNVLEYVSDKDSGILVKNLCNDLPDNFWQHIYNIGGGDKMRASSYNLYKRIFGIFGFKKLDLLFDTKWFALRNFHGQYYLDGDKLENYLHFRNNGMEYTEMLQTALLYGFAGIIRVLLKIPFIKKLAARIIKDVFKKLTKGPRGTMDFINNNNEDAISAYFISKEEWQNIPDWDKFEPYEHWNEAIFIDHGYDEKKPPEELCLEDIKGAAEFRGGKCLSESMVTGDWNTPLKFECAFGHSFTGSPRLILEGGHWCDTCEREYWNYHEIAKKNPFFAQVWYPLHSKHEIPHPVKKEVNEINYLD